MFIVTSGINPTSEHAGSGALAGFAHHDPMNRSSAQRRRTYKVTVTDAEIDEALKGVAEQNGLATVAQLDALLTGSGLEPNTLRYQGRHPIGLGQTCRRPATKTSSPSRMRPSTRRWKRASSETPPTNLQYQVSEIFLGVSTLFPNRTMRSRATPSKIMQQIDLGVPFNVAARQLSQAPSAAQGGNIGWAVDGELSPDLNRRPWRDCALGNPSRR